MNHSKHIVGADRAGESSTLRLVGVDPPSISAMTRRSVMNALVSVASVAAASATLTPSDAFAVHPDAELLDLAAQVPALAERQKRTRAELDRIEQIYFARRPGRPAELKWRHTDPVGHWPARAGEPEGSLWCNEQEIEDLRHKPIVRREFIGTDEDWAALPSGENGPLTQDELAQRAPFWKDVPDERGQARFNEIVAAYDKYEAALEALKVELGYAAAEEIDNGLWNRCGDILDKIVGTPAHSMDGLRAKAQAADAWWWRGDVEGDVDGCDEALLKSIARDLLRRPSASGIGQSPTARKIDPIFALIEQHRAASVEWLRHVKIEGELQEIIPAEKTENYRVHDRDNPEVGENDDPRWTAARKEYWAASDRLDGAAVALIEVKPTTVAGVAALLGYFAKTQADTDGSVFPDTLEDDDDPAVKKYGAPYAYFVARNAGAALPGMAEA